MIKDYLSQKRELVDTYIRQWLTANTCPVAIRLQESMGYSLLAKGKRLRPILCLAVADVLKIAPLQIMPLAVAIEMIHVFSLIHDDLPAMDNDDWRRGQLTNHKKFDEATAILTGDNLLTHAFEQLAALDCSVFEAKNILTVINQVAKSTGSFGMIAGQMLDMLAENKKITLLQLQELHAHKTGALICVAVESPSLLISSDSITQQALKTFGKAIGLAFQIADDILDATGSAEWGKKPGSDVARHKSTYVTHLGLDEAKKLCQQAHADALEALQTLQGDTNTLKNLADFMVSRNW